MFAFFLVVHGADGSAGSRAVHSEGKIVILALFSSTLTNLPKKRHIFIANMFPPPSSNCSTLCVRRLLRAWWTPPSNLHWVHSGTSLMNHQLLAAILLRTRAWTCLLKCSRYTEMLACTCKYTARTNIQNSLKALQSRVALYKYVCLWGALTHCCFVSITPTSPFCSPSPMSLQSSRRFSACWWVYCYYPLEKLNVDKFTILRHHYSPFTYCCVEQHRRGRGAACRADGAGVLGPHQHSAAQPRGGGQLLRCRHPCTFDVTRRGSLDTQPWPSILTAGASGRNQ